MDRTIPAAVVGLLLLLDSTNARGDYEPSLDLRVEETGPVAAGSCTWDEGDTALTSVSVKILYHDTTRIGPAGPITYVRDEGERKLLWTMNDAPDLPPGDYTLVVHYHIQGQIWPAKTD